MLLDTNVYSALANGSQAAVETIASSHDLRLPLPVIAELRYRFHKGSQKERNEEMLQRFLTQPHVSIVEPSMKTTNVYAELQLYCVQRGKVLSHNDVWIAALAHESDDTLVTFDKDLSVFSTLFGDKLVVLSK
jgi:predicted nucleic acid-binding protein